MAWIAELPNMPGIFAYGETEEEAQAALRRVAGRLKRGEPIKQHEASELNWRRRDPEWDPCVWCRCTRCHLHPASEETSPPRTDGAFTVEG
jgi:hypothetical protein